MKKAGSKSPVQSTDFFGRPLEQSVLPETSGIACKSIAQAPGIALIRSHTARGRYSAWASWRTGAGSIAQSRCCLTPGRNGS